MPALLEQFLDQFLKGLYGEGSRIVKIKALSVGLRALQGTRRLLVLHYVMMSACVLWALSFFSTSLLAFYRLSNGSFLFGAPALYFSSTLLFFSTLALYMSCREKTWMDAFGIQNQIEQLEREAAEEAARAAQNLSREAIAAIIDQVLEQKLQKMAEQTAQKPTPAAPIKVEPDPKEQAS